MVTLRQLITKNQKRLKKFHKCKTPALLGCPQKKGVITSIIIIRPKKPNSARRHIAKLYLSTGKKIRAAIPGGWDSKNKPLKKFSKVLVRGGRIRDIIGIRYKIILGKFDANPLYKRKTSRSKYGVKQIYAMVY